MMRAILVPPVLSPGALTELKNWLGVSVLQDDDALIGLLGAALDMCEAFTRQMPLQCDCEEVLTPTHGWQPLATMPVHAITGAEALQPSGARVPLAAGDYAIDIDGAGLARFRLLSPAVEGPVAVRLTAGIATGWDSLPAALRHGVVRLAAHTYRQRENECDKPLPPAAVAALWSPWRRLRLA
jgi:uncharacterized phiE125 gp8 family phage protein